MAEVMVRMAELAVASSADDVLVSLGLGSCIGVALIDRGNRAAGLAHVVLPDSREASAAAGSAKFADTAIPALVAKLARLGAPRGLLTAVLVGGAQMFLFGSQNGSRLEIGARNERAVREALRAAGIPVAVAVTGGSTGRTVRVRVGEGLVTCKEAGKGEYPIYGGETVLPKAA